MRSIKGTLAYWKKVFYEVLSMVKQVGQPAFFMRLIAELKWGELISIRDKSKGEKLISDRINSMNYFEGLSYLNFNLVLITRQFQYITEAFFQTIVLNGPLGRVKYYAMRVEFQVCGSPYIPSNIF